MVKLFLAEDEIAMREGIKRTIPWKEDGIEFCGEAGDGELAWPIILEQRPDIVITDIKMPFMDGLQLAGLIRKELPDTKIVILSGYAVNIAIADSREDGYKPSRNRKKERQRRLKERPHYALRTDNPNCRQPRGSNIYHSPSGIGKMKNTQQAK